MLADLPWSAVLCQPRPCAPTKATREGPVVPETANPWSDAVTVMTCRGARRPPVSLPSYRQAEPFAEANATASLRPTSVRPGRMITKAGPLAASPAIPAAAPWFTGTFTGRQVAPPFALRHRPGDSTLAMIFRLPRCSTTGREISPPTMITPAR